MSTPEAPNSNGLMIVLFVTSSNSILYDVVIPGTTDSDILSPDFKLWDSLQTTVPTFFCIKPVTSVFCGFKLCLTPVPWLLKKSCRPVVPIPVIAPVDPIPIGFSDSPKKFWPSLIA